VTRGEGPAARARTVRDPLWQNLHLSAEAADVVDTPAFQRLRRVKQLGFAHLVYPGAVHTRFLHALGVYHLTRRAVDALERSGALGRLSPGERELLPLVTLAALLHDVGHYAFSHAMEEIEPGSLPGHHEEVGGRFLHSAGIERALRRVHPGALDRIARLIRGDSDHPLQGLVSGPLDLDKIDYLRRDAFFCGVPYGAVDVDRLLGALTLEREGDGRLEVAVTEKGISALESLLFSKYQMFRNVYWHHAVRAATATFRRLVETVLAAGVLARDELPGRTDEELMGLLERRAEEGSPASDEIRRERLARLRGALVHRRLPKRVVEVFGDELPDGMGDWIQSHPRLVRRLEERLSREWGPGEDAPGAAVLVDYPAYPGMLELGLLLRRRDGEVQRLTSAGEEGLIDLPRVGRSLHHSARVFRVYALPPTRRRDPGPILELLEASPQEVEARLEDSRPLC